LTVSAGGHCLQETLPEYIESWSLGQHIDSGDQQFGITDKERLEEGLSPSVYDQVHAVPDDEDTDDDDFDPLRGLD
jgi:hypothetical protein